MADVAKIADKPKAAAKICTKVPLAIPQAAVEPALKPWEALRPMMYKESGPGMMFNMMPEMTNSQSSLIPNSTISPYLLPPKQDHSLAQ